VEENQEIDAVTGVQGTGNFADFFFSKKNEFFFPNSGKWSWENIGLLLFGQLGAA
jgi:hypothetical protein